MDLFAARLLGGYDDEQLFTLLTECANHDRIFAEASFRAGDPASSDLVRARALDIIGKLQPARPEYVSFARAGLSDGSALVIRAAAWALVHLGGDEATIALMTVMQSCDPCVRLAVSTGVGASLVEGASETLIHLMEDEDDEVRNWSTFGLGQLGITLSRKDAPDVLSALERRLNDLHPDVRDEALWGLALRRHPQALIELLKRLGTEALVQGDEDVASEILGPEGEHDIESLRSGLTKLIGLREPKT